MEQTIDGRDYLYKQVVGYPVNTMLDDSARAKVRLIQQHFRTALGESLWLTPLETLHVTLLDWLAPFADYGPDKDVLFKQVFPEYNALLESICMQTAPLQVMFNDFIVSPSAVAIVARGDCADRINAIRQRFVSQVELLPGTKQPPNILHSTIIRFTGAIPVQTVVDVANKCPISIDTVIDGFQLVRESTVPMQTYEVQKTYALQNDAL